MSTTVTVWKTRPVFVSSTFRDMQAERDHLRNVVFPRLEEKLRERRIHLEEIDLRQGVETTAVPDEAAREMLVLKVCLDEIKRSRPFLVVLLGDRYGWVPPDDRMAAAAQEAGFQADLKGKSVTALEVEFGILKEDPEQRRRSFFFFRDPLPCQDPDYNDKFSPDPAVCARHAELEALKQKIVDDKELGPRVHRYRAGWDEANRRVILSREWADDVFNRIWPDLDDETKAFALLPPPTWEEAERRALAEFVELRALGFVGRDKETRCLLEMARGDTAQTPWGACVIGVPGSGKSALFAHLYRDLVNPQSPRRPVFVLANAAGTSTRAASVDAMLRRWIQELADFLKTANPLPEKATNDDVENTFYSLLNRAAGQQRVIVLIDALNQFEPTVRAQHLTWFKPRAWPSNARFVATSLPWPGADILAQTTGVETVNLSSLTLDNARQIAENVWGRYHRQPNEGVFQVLAKKQTVAGAAAGNPLWLNLALEQLNLLDADDFARAEREFAGTPDRRLQAMQVDVASRLPAEVEGLFDVMLANAEKVHGEGWARAFATAIALSRFGWRESDLLALAPKLAPALVPGWAQTGYDALRLASLRRAFRGQVVKRGELEQWDFFHAQMRVAVLRRCAPNDAAAKKLHGLIADHLLSLRPIDSLRENETMHHLVEADDQPRAARFYASLRVPVGGPNLATETLARRILEATDSDVLRAMMWVAGLLAQPGLTSGSIAVICIRFQYDLNRAFANTGNLWPRRVLLEAAREAGQRLADSDLNNVVWQRDLATSQEMIGSVLYAQGNLVGALREYRASLHIRERLATSEPGNAEWQRGLSASRSGLGSVLHAQGDLAGALREYRACLQIGERLATSDPSNAVWQQNLSIDHGKLGNVLRAQGDLAGALREYRANLQISERLAASEPSNIKWQYELAASRERVGNALILQGDLAGALREFRASLQVSERRAASDPSNADKQWDLSIIRERIGDVLLAQHNLAGALREYRACHQIIERLAASDPTNAGWQRDLAVSHGRLGNVLSAQGDPAGGLREYRASMEISERLSASDPSNAEWRRDLVVTYKAMYRFSRKLGQGDAKVWLMKAFSQLVEMKKPGAVFRMVVRERLNQLFAKLRGKVRFIIAAIIILAAVGVVWYLGVINPLLPSWLDRSTILSTPLSRPFSP